MSARSDGVPVYSYDLPRAGFFNGRIMCSKREENTKKKR